MRCIANAVAAERLGLAALLGLLVVSNVLPASSQEWDRAAILDGEIWRLWSGQFCHWSLFHLLGNLAALVALGVLIGPAVRTWLALLPLAAPVLSLGLFAVAQLERYRGLSGLVAVLVVAAAVEGGILGRVVALGYGLKLAFDSVTGSHSGLLPSGVATTWQAHVGGLLIGGAIAVVLSLRKKTSQTSP